MSSEATKVFARRVAALFSTSTTLNPDDFTEPGPVCAINEISDKQDDELRKIGEGVLSEMRLTDALRIARIALYDVSIAPGGLVDKSYRDRATRAIVQINALKIEDEGHD